MHHYDLRRASRRMDDDALRDVLARGQFCTLACIDANSNPYAVPLSYIYEEGSAPEGRAALYFHTTNEGGRKLDAFAADPRACATVVEDVRPRFYGESSFTTDYSSVMAEGRIRRVTDPVEVRKALVGLCMKYLPDHKQHIGAAMEADLAATAVWALDIDRLSGKRNAAE